MTTAAATAVEEELDLEMIHPIWSAKYQIQIAEKELTTLGQTEQALAEERMVILKERDTEAPGIKTRLQDLESEINRLQIRQSREGDKIKSLTDELPELREEAQVQLDKLAALKKRLPEVSLEVESLNAQLASLLNAELVEQLIDLVEKRNEVAKELKGLPFLISNTRSFFHLQPGVEQIDVPKLPGHLRELTEALSK